MKKKLIIYTILFILIIPLLYFLAEYNSYKFITWDNTNTTYLSSPIGVMLNSLQTHTKLFLYPFYIVFLILMHKGYKNISNKVYIIIICIFTGLAFLNFTILYKIFLPSIWWSWSIFALIHAITLIIFKNCKKH